MNYPSRLLVRLVSILFILWWLIAAVGVALIILGLWKTSILGFLEVEGWRRYYLLGGSLTVFVMTIRLAPTLVREGLNLVMESPTKAIIAVVALCCIPILLIPLATAGWPLVVWLAWDSWKDTQAKEKENETV